MPLNFKFIRNQTLLFYIIFGNRNPLYPALGSNVPSARRPGQRFHFLQCRGSSPSLLFVNRHGGTLRRAGWVAFTKVTDIAFTSDFCNNHSHPASPTSLYLTSPRPRPTRPRVPYLMSLSPSSRVPKSQVPTHASRCPRPLFPPPPHFYTQPWINIHHNTLYLHYVVLIDYFPIPHNTLCCPPNFA